MPQLYQPYSKQRKQLSKSTTELIEMTEILQLEKSNLFTKKCFLVFEQLQAATPGIHPARFATNRNS